MGQIAVVTDSSAYLPTGLANDRNVSVVPLSVIIDGRARLEGIDVSAADLADALGDKRRTVTTSRPSPGAFHELYERLLTTASHVVSIHLSSELSGTVDAALIAAGRFPAGAVTVVDSRSTAMALGFSVLAARSAADHGADAAAVAQVAREVATSCTAVFSVDTLEHLRRGGRISATSKLVGSALSIKPILEISGGTITLLERVRTSSKARARLADLAVEAAGDRSVDVAVHHLGAPEAAAALARSLDERIPVIDALITVEVGAAIGAHVGPGLLGVVVAPPVLHGGQMR